MVARHVPQTARSQEIADRSGRTAPRQAFSAAVLLFWSRYNPAVVAVWFRCKWSVIPESEDCQAKLLGGAETVTNRHARRSADRNRHQTVTAYWPRWPAARLRQVARREPTRTETVAAEANPAGPSGLVDQILGREPAPRGSTPSAPVVGRAAPPRRLLRAAHGRRGDDAQPQVDGAEYKHFPGSDR